MRFSVDLLPGATGNSPACSLKTLLSTAVALESGIGVVIATTVCFDDQASVTPEEVGFQATTTDIEGHVDLGLGKAALAAHAKEQSLQLASGPLGLRVEFVEKEAEAGDPAAAPAASQQRTQSGQIDNP